MRTFILLIVLVSFNAYSQDLVVVSKVTDDSIAIKWLPNNFEQLVLITKGATISRAISDKPLNFELVNFTNAKQWQIIPTKERIDLLGTSEQDENFLNRSLKDQTARNNKTLQC